MGHAQQAVHKFLFLARETKTLQTVEYKDELLNKKKTLPNS